MPDGIFVVNKPIGLTSHDVVMEARRALGIRRVGHTGTLDPMAEGVLVLVIGSATKVQQQLQGHRKVYEATMRLGIQTDTGDAWGRVVQEAPVPPLTQEDIAAVLASCVGRLTQTPPTFSAVKVQGRPLYWWARRGMPRVAQPRMVDIFSIELLAYAQAHLRCRLECSAGTYVRTLAETIAQQLGTLGHVSQLTRLAVGPWTLAQAVELGWLSTASPSDVMAKIQPVEAILHAPAART